MKRYEFSERLEFSRSCVDQTPLDLIAVAIAGVVSVAATDVSVDRTGVDYIATTRRGATIGIDHKAREEGCSRYWASGPELALETWSVVPDRWNVGKAGWTLDEAKATDYTLHTFAASDSSKFYLLPFHMLRTVFREHVTEWSQRYRTATQNSGGWRSQCVFVPATVVTGAVHCAMEGNRWTMGEWLAVDGGA